MTDETKLFSAGAPKPETGETAPAPLETTQAPVESQVQEAIVEAEKIEAADEEKTILLNRARMMGLSVSNNSSVATLKAKIAEKLASEETTQEAAQSDEDDAEEDEEVKEEQILPPETRPTDDRLEQPPAPVAAAVEPAVVRKPKRKSLMAHLYEKQMRLVRVRISNLDPKKRTLKGEFFTFANEYLGSVTKFIPYGEGSEDGYHVPVCILNQLKARTFQDIREVKNKKTGIIEHKAMDVREFAIEELPPLTQADLDQLAAAQMAKGGLDGE